MTTTATPRLQPWQPPTIRATKTALKQWRALIAAGDAPDTDLEQAVVQLIPPPGTPREDVRVKNARRNAGIILGNGWRAAFEKKPGLDGRKYWSITEVQATAGAAASGLARARARARAMSA